MKLDLLEAALREQEAHGGGRVDVHVIAGFKVVNVGTHASDQALDSRLGELHERVGRVEEELATWGKEPSQRAKEFVWVGDVFDHVPERDQVETRRGVFGILHAAASHAGEFEGVGRVFHGAGRDLVPVKLPGVITDGGEEEAQPRSDIEEAS